MYERQVFLVLGVAALLTAVYLAVGTHLGTSTAAIFGLAGIGFMLGAVAMAIVEHSRTK
jgi:hypothetical protein